MSISAALLRLTPLWWGLLCTLPLISGLLGRWIKQKPWFVDFDAIACGGLTLARGGNPYDLTPACEGLRPAVFVYAPPVAEAVANTVEFIGFDLFRGLYLTLWLTALIGIGLYALVVALPSVDLRLKLPVFALLTGGTLASGNIAILLHGLILVGALALPRRVTPFIICVAVAALIKPTLLTYLIVLAYVDKPALWRLMAGLGGAVAGLGGYALILLSQSPLNRLWQSALDTVVLTQQPGISYFAWMEGFGIDGTSPVGLIGLLAVMGLLCLSGLALAELGRLSGSQRLVVGLGIAQLLNPRLMDYDLLLLIPFVALIVALGLHLKGAWPKGLIIGLNGLCAGVLLLNLIDQTLIMPVPLGVLGLTVITVVVAGGLTVTRWSFAVDRVKRAGFGLIGKPLNVPAAE